MTRLVMHQPSPTSTSSLASSSTSISFTLDVFVSIRCITSLVIVSTLSHEITITCQQQRCCQAVARRHHLSAANPSMWNTKSTISSSYSQKASILTLMSNTYKLHNVQMRLDEAKIVNQE